MLIVVTFSLLSNCCFISCSHTLYLVVRSTLTWIWFVLAGLWIEIRRSLTGKRTRPLQLLLRDRCRGRCGGVEGQSLLHDRRRGGTPSNDVGHVQSKNWVRVLKEAFQVDAGSQGWSLLIVLVSNCNPVLYYFEKYWFDEYELPEVRNCTSMCWSL